MSYDSDQARTRELKRLKARVDELEEENERLCTALRKIRKQTNETQANAERVDAGQLWLIAHRALDGGGGST